MSPRRPAPRPHRVRGYSLIEVIVAFSLLAAGLGLLLGVLSHSVDQIRWSARMGEAVAHADTLLDGIGVGAPIMEGRFEGESPDGRYRWSMQVGEYEPPEGVAIGRSGEREPEPGPGSPLASLDETLRLYRIDLDIVWGERERERLAISTLRLNRVPPDGAEPLL